VGSDVAIPRFCLIALIFVDFGPVDFASMASLDLYWPHVGFFWGTVNLVAL
jgi:hypothetical protein